MKNNNAGFSLPELIVVVAMLVIVGAIGAGWIGRLSGYRARECSGEITSTLTQTKVQAMSKSVNIGDVYWKLYQNTDKKYYVTVHTPKQSGATEDNEETIKVGQTNNLTVTYTDTAGSHIVGTDVTELRLTYKRSTGEICIYDNSSATWSSSSISKIEVTNGTRTYKIEITPKTGKISGTH